MSPPRHHVPLPRSGFPRRRQASAGVRLLLITGTPGTGKRPVGSYLSQEHGFVHLDFENAETRARFLESGDAGLRAAIAAAREAGSGLVITWSAASEGQLRQLRRVQSLGFESIWFDSDRGAACQALFAGDARGAQRFHFVDSFDTEGRFRPVGAVSADLLEARPRERRRPVREVVAAAGRTRSRVALAGAGSSVGGLRWRIVGGLALAGAAAAAGAAVLLGTQGGVPQPSALAPVGHTHARATVAALPRRGVLVNGRSLAGVRLGDTPAQVRALWGHNFTRCHGCKPQMWFYFLPTGDPVGAGVEFRGGRVVAVFTLGGPTGWHTETGLKVGQMLNPFNDPNDPSKWKSCAGFSAKSAPTTGNAVTSILTQGQSVYGFALTRPSISPCQ
jgi:hypothetical protein